MITTAWKITRNAFLSLSVLTLIQPAAPTEATPGYTAAETASASGPKLRSDMTDYDPAMLSIHFYPDPEIPCEQPENTAESGNMFADLQQPAPEASPAEAQPEEAIQTEIPAPIAPIATPEPGTFALLGLGLGALAFQLRRKNRV